MTENEFRTAVLAECARRKLRVYHVPSMARANVRGTAKGWPDLVIATEHGILFRELKTPDGETTAGQDWWLWLLSSNGLDTAIWRPADLDSGLIGGQLDALTGRAQGSSGRGITEAERTVLPSGS
jgi:hypothetical protein